LAQDLDLPEIILAKGEKIDAVLVLVD